VLGTLRNGLRLMALHRLRDPDLADDVVQETLARALAAIREGKAGDIRDLGAFVHGIARHVILDFIRARQRDAGAEPLRDTADPASLRDALSHVVSAEERARVRAALQQLTASDRNILHLSFFEGLSCTEVAERLGLNSLRVRKRKSRALERLRRVFLGDAAGHESRPAATESEERARVPMHVPEMST
jgi:RNA polymerase sigma-70 factor (ECF subfamily)